MHTLKSDVQERVDYYEEDESLVDAQERYYGESESVSKIDRMTHAVWAGSAAKAAGITGEILREDFKTVLRGNLPTTGERIRWQNPNPENKERLAHDVVLSAPKSISMALHLEGDTRLFDAHMEAVQETLDFIEKEVAQTRIQTNGIRSVVQTGNLIAALIPHHTSRDGDMQLHTHMLVMNGTKGPDGVWRSLSHESLASAEWVGSYYRQKLAEKAQGLGYRIYGTEHGFELEGYDRRAIEVFSKRNQAIVREVMGQGQEINPENKKAAVLTTRKAKSTIGQKLEELQTQWQAEAQREGIGQPILSQPLEVMGCLATGVYEVESAIQHLSENAVSFSRSDIYAYAFKHIHQQGLQIEHLNQAIAQRKDLMPLPDRRMTTVDALERESETVEKWQQGKGKAQPFMDIEAAKVALDESSLNAGQLAAVLGIASATDQHLIVQGLSGVGKTYALGELKQLIEASEQDTLIRGFCPTISAAHQLQDALGIETGTVESLVRRTADTTANQLWIIDEAGMVGGEQMLNIVNKAEKFGARILLVGDTGQNSSVKAGSPMRNLMYNGATTFQLSKIIRQQNAMQRRAVELIANGQPVDALRLLHEHGYVQEVPSRKDRTTAIAQQYLSLNPTERSKTLIVTGTNAERYAITQAIRSGLKTEGSLGQETTILQLRTQYLTKEQKRRVENFEPGSYVQLLQDYKSTPLVKKKLYQVIGQDGDELLVSSAGGRLYRFNPAHYGDKEVFKAQPLAVAVGDRLRWTTSNRKAGQINGAEFTVLDVSDQQLIFANKQGKQTLSLNQPIGVDYALVSTSYRAQGQTAKRVIVSATNGPTTAKEPFYVKISRQTHEIQVYAEDLDSLKDWVRRSNAQDNAIELLGEQYGSDSEPRTEVRPDHRTERPTSAAVPSTTRAERKPELPGAGADEHPTAGSESIAERIHNRIHRSPEPTEIRQDGRLNRPSHESDGRTGTESRRLEHGESANELPSSGSSRPNQGHLQPNPQEWPTEATEAREGWSRDTLTTLAQTLQDLRAESSLEAVIEERLGTIIEQIERLSSCQLRPTFNGIAELAEAVTSQHQEANLLNAIAQVNSELERFSSETREQAPQFRNMAELATAVTATQQLQVIQDSELTDKITALLEQVEAMTTSPRPTPQFEGMADLAQAVTSQQQQSGLTQAIAQVSAEIERFTEEITFASRRDKAAVIGSAIKQWRTEQLISGAVLGDNPQQALQNLSETLSQVQAFGDVRPEMAQLVSAIQQHQSQKELMQSIENLSEQMAPTAPRWPAIRTLAQAISDRHAETAIADQIEPFNIVSKQLQTYLIQRTDLQELAKAVRTIRSTEQPEGAAAEHLQQIADNLRQMNISPTPKPIKREIFWQPDYSTAVRPDSIEPHHWEEFQRSAIHPDLIAANVESISGEDVYERLLSERLANMGTGQYVTQPMARLMAVYEPLTEGGWWGKAGIDAKSLLTLETGQLPDQNPWGCFKADNPRIDQDKSDRQGETVYIKYENPLGTPRSLYLANVPDSLAERIYQKHGVDPSETEKVAGFWSVVRQYNLPITLTEGAKKTWASLSQGEITIGLSGVNGLYRSKDSEQNRLSSRQLDEEIEVFTNPLTELEMFVSPGREFRFAFDQDAKTSTVFNVRRELVRGVELLEDKGCLCKIVSWDGRQGKGLDDLIANQGPRAFTSAIARATTAERAKRIYYRTEYNALARQVRSELPNATPPQIDGEVYLRAIAKGDPKDGNRFLSQSDQARAIKDPALVTAYIEQVKAQAPQFRSQQRQLESDKANYQAIAKGVRDSYPDIPTEQLDMAVCLVAQDNQLEPTRILAHSEQVKLNPEQAQAYIDRIEGKAAQYRQQQAPPPTTPVTPDTATPNDVEQEPPNWLSAITDKEKAQQRVQQAVAATHKGLRDQYNAIAQQVTAQLGQVPSQVMDIEVYLRTKNPDQAKRLIQVGDTMSALRHDNSSLHGHYFDAIAQVAPAYQAIKDDPTAKMNLKQMAAIVNNTNAKLLEEREPTPNVRPKKKREDEIIL